MKKWVVISFLFISGTARTQWVQQFSDEYHSYSAIFFKDELNGWVGGNYYSGNSFILRTTNGGEDWESSEIGSGPQSITFTNSNIGYCTAFNGIYKTTDSGESWILSFQDNLRYYNSIQFIDENRGWAVAQNDSGVYLLKTENSGESWEKFFVESSGFSDSKLKMINDSTGFILLIDSKIRKTTDGGKNWFIVNNNSSNGNQLFDISFSDELNGFICGINTFLYTSDGGNNWEKNFVPITFCEKIYSKGDYLWVSGFGLGYNSAIIFSDDNGDTWTPTLVDDNKDIHDIFFTNLNSGWYCSITFETPLYNGSIYKTEPGWLDNINIPSQPKQVYPADDSLIENLFSLEWEKLDHCLYRVHISEDPLFSELSVIINTSTGDTVFYGDKIYIHNNNILGLPFNKTYYWRVRSENKLGVSEWSDTWSFTISSPTNIENDDIPLGFKLYQNYPNPFNPSTKINFSLPERSFISLKIYNSLGEEIEVLINEEFEKGNHEYQWNAENLPAGIYFYSLTSNKFLSVKKMVLLK